MSLNDCIDHGKRGDKDGYARKWLSRSQYVMLHRLVYAEYKGISIDSLKGLVVRHTCDNTRCINPDHLLAGNHADNMRDMSERKRHGKRKLTDEQVYEIRSTCVPSTRGKHSDGPTCYSLSRKFGVNHSVINAVLKRKTFKHLP